MVLIAPNKEVHGMNRADRMREENVRGHFEEALGLFDMSKHLLSPRKWLLSMSSDRIRAMDVVRDSAMALLSRL